MVFDYKMLSPQHKGIFSLPWIAATRGIKYINKSDIIETDIVKICIQVMDFINQECKQPSRRFSLRLTATIANGIIKIFREKVFILKADVITLITYVRTPSGLLLSTDSSVDIGMFSTPTTPITKVKVKKIKKGEATAEHGKEQLAIEEILSEDNGIMYLEELKADLKLRQSRLDDITIREDMPKGAGKEIDDEAFGFGPIGVDELMEQDEFLSTFERAPIEKPSAKRKPDTDSTPSDNQPPKKILVVAQIHAPAESESLQIEAVLPTKEEEIITSPEIKVVLSEIVTETKLKSRKEIFTKDVVSPLTVKNATQHAEKGLRLNFRSKRIIKIDRCQPQELEEITSKLAVQFVDKITPIMTELYKEIQLDDETEQFMAEFDVARTSTQDMSTTNGSPEEIHIPSILSGTPEFSDMLSPANLQPELGVHSLQRKPIGESFVEAEVQKKSAILAEDVPLPQVVAGNDIPQQMRRELFPEIGVEIDIISTGKHAEAIPEVAATGTQKSSEDEAYLTEKTTERERFIGDPKKSDAAADDIMQKNRQIEILKIVQNHDPSKEELVIEDVCPRPINKKNVAVTFFDLLVLCRAGFVNLVSAEDSCELKHIIKGSKII